MTDPGIIANLRAKIADQKLQIAGVHRRIREVQTERDKLIVSVANLRRELDRAQRTSAELRSKP